MKDEEKKAIKYVNNILDYELHYCEDEDVLLLTRIDKEQIKTVLNLIQKQQAELEKKDKIIDEMAARVYLNEEEREEMEKDIYNNVNHKGFADFVKRYFEMKVRKEND